MSHIATVKTQMTEIEALKDAVEAAGGVWKQDQKTHNFYSGTGRCDHAFGLPGVHYEVGVTKNLDGSLSLSLDDYGYENSRHDGYKLVAKFGANGSALMQGYAKSITVREMRRKGYHVSFQQQENGAVRVVARR